MYYLCHVEINQQLKKEVKMGQYYKSVILEKDKKTIKCFTQSIGSLKLTEHSWLRNPFVKAFETLLINTPQRVVWAGDYAEPFEDQTETTYIQCREDQSLLVKPKGQSKLKDRYIVNHSKNLFVDKKAIPKDTDGWRKHPLPFLICDGNGQGGGDYFGEDKQGLVGSWARDLISIESELPPRGYIEIKFDLH